jgi:hypothetical protein
MTLLQALPGDQLSSFKIDRRDPKIGLGEVNDQQSIENLLHCNINCSHHSYNTQTKFYARHSEERSLVRLNGDAVKVTEGCLSG